MWLLFILRMGNSLLSALRRGLFPSMDTSLRLHAISPFGCDVVYLVAMSVYLLISFSGVNEMVLHYCFLSL